MHHCLPAGLAVPDAHIRRPRADGQAHFTTSPRSAARQTDTSRSSRRPTSARATRPLSTPGTAAAAAEAEPGTGTRTVIRTVMRGWRGRDTTRTVGRALATVCTRRCAPRTWRTGMVRLKGPGTGMGTTGRFLAMGTCMVRACPVKVEATVRAAGWRRGMRHRQRALLPLRIDRHRPDGRLQQQRTGRMCTSGAARPT